jgi:uroporphyrin-III C-methyltransferase
VSFDEAATCLPVSLVGAGPGDPELLTVRATRRLAAADVVLHDRLLDPRVLALAAPDARLIDVGKGPSTSEEGRGWTQDRINELLVLFALAGHRVVRLKGGDPFVFGRGREEADALDAAGIPWEVVPGVSSALAAPAAVGIPVTHRAMAATFTVVTGSRAPGEPEPDWEALARLGGTIVVLMGVAKRAAIAERLMAAGLAPDTPVAAVVEATQSTQDVLTSTLQDLGSLAVRNPAVLVIGSVASFAATAHAAISTHC